MTKVIMVCGKICSGKSTYAECLRKDNNAVLLSIDEIMLAIFGQNAGEKHNEYVQNVQRYIFDKTLEILQTNTSVILDCGFWTKAHRDFTKEFCIRHGFPCELHYIDISDELWQERIIKRNSAVSAGKTSAYYVDEGLAEKFTEGFETPTDEEIDIRISTEGQYGIY